MVPRGVVLNMPIGWWNSLKMLESGTMLLEARNGKLDLFELMDNVE